MILRGTWPCAVWYCAELDSAQYDTARKKYEFLGENETKNETILTHWSVGQAGSNDEQNWGSKISLDCPFKLIWRNDIFECEIL